VKTVRLVAQVVLVLWAFWVTYLLEVLIQRANESTKCEIQLQFCIDEIGGGGWTYADAPSCHPKDQ
jgi:hypothetical protein